MGMNGWTSNNNAENSKSGIGSKACKSLSYEGTVTTTARKIIPKRIIQPFVRLWDCFDRLWGFIRVIDRQVNFFVLYIIG